MFYLFFFNPTIISNLIQKQSIEFVNFLADNKVLNINVTFITTINFF